MSTAFFWALLTSVSFGLIGCQGKRFALNSLGKAREINILTPSTARSTSNGNGWAKIAGECELAGDGVALSGDISPTTAVCIGDGHFSVVVNLKNEGKNTVSIKQMQSDGVLATSRRIIISDSSADTSQAIPLIPRGSSTDGFAGFSSGSVPIQSSYDGSVAAFNTAHPERYVEGQSNTPYGFLFGPIIYNVSEHNTATPWLDTNGELFGGTVKDLSMDGSTVVFDTRNTELLDGGTVYSTGAIIVSASVDGQDQFIVNEDPRDSSIPEWTYANTQLTNNGDATLLAFPEPHHLRDLNGVEERLLVAEPQRITGERILPDEVRSQASLYIDDVFGNDNYVLFRSNHNFTDGSASVLSGAYVFDRSTRQIEGFARNPDSGETLLYIFRPHISEDGNFAVFNTRSNLLLDGDPSIVTGGHIYRQDRRNGALIRVSGNAELDVPNASYTPQSFSADGRFTLYTAAYWTSKGCAGKSIISAHSQHLCLWLHDAQDDSRQLLLQNDNGDYHGVMTATLSPDGRFIFVATRSNLNSNYNLDGELVVYRIPNPAIFE